MRMLKKVKMKMMEDNNKPKKHMEATSLSRIHLKNIPARDMSQFLREQGATTMAYPLRYAEEERSSYSRKLAISRRVEEILSPRCVYRRRSSLGYSFLLAPCGIDKISRNASRGYFRDGF